MSRVPHKVWRKAKQFAACISDPSTVRVRLIDEFGIDTPLPTTASLAELRAAHEGAKFSRQPSTRKRA